MNTTLARTILSTAILAVIAAVPAGAQSTPPSADEAFRLDEIAVTAQRREEQPQKIPLTLTVISGAALDRMQVKRLDDVKFSTPNLVIEQNTGTSSGAKIIMRGVGTDESMFTNDPAIALYIDDVYIPRQNGSMFDLYDVERIEVLRGPQGTLYGRNATGGAIRYISRKPDGESRFTFDGSLGNMGRIDGRAMLSTRAGESLDVNAAVLSRNRDGFMHDISHDRKVNDQDVLAGRIGLATIWGEASYATLSIDRLRERSTPGWASPVAFGPDGDSMIPRLGSFYETETDTLGLNNIDQTGIALTNETDFGGFSWRNILHYRKMDHHFYMDIDGTDRLIYHVDQDQKQNQKGYEAQFTSQGSGPVSWVAGVFAFHEDNDQPTRNDIFAVGATNFLKQSTKAYAAYAQGIWSITDRLRATGGARYSRESKDFDVRVVRTDGSLNFERSLSNSWSRPDWKLALDFDFSDEVMGYVSATTGFKSGGYNGRGTTPETITTVDAEKLIAYEIGVKSTLADGRVRLNADYYRLDYDGIQLAAVNADGIFVLTNATGALIQGVEMDLEAQLTRRLNMTASVGTIDSKYQKYNEVNADYFRDLPLKYSPDLQWTLGATWIQPTGSGDLVFAAQARYTDGYYSNQDASRMIMTRAHTEANARIAYEPDHGNWSVALWGKNLTNRFAVAGGFDIAGLGIGVIYPNVPRTYGVEFKYRFW